MEPQRIADDAEETGGASDVSTCNSVTVVTPLGYEVGG
jgi:hypothetical protein